MGMRGAGHGMGMRGMHRMGQTPSQTPRKGTFERGVLTRRIFSLFAPYRTSIGIIVVSIVFTAGLGVVNPLLIKVIFDTALFCGSGCPNLSRLYSLVGIMAAVPIVTGIIGIGQTYLTNRVGQRVMEDLRNSLYAHLQRLSLGFFTGTRTGEVQSRLTNDVAGVQTVVTDTASSIISNVVILGSTVIAMLFLSWQLTALSLCLMPLFLFFTYRAGKARRAIASKTQESRAEMSAITQETLSVSGILLTKVFGRYLEEQQRFREENRRLADLAIRQEMIGRSLFAVVGAFFSMAPALVYLVAGLVIHAHAGSITAGTIVAFTTLQSRLFFPIGQMLQVSVEIQASLALFERVLEYLDLVPDIGDKPDAVQLDPQTIRGEVSFENVWFRYPSPEGSSAETTTPPPSSRASGVLIHGKTGPAGGDRRAFRCRQDHHQLPDPAPLRRHSRSGLDRFP